jgi:hypothetical protein
MLPTTSRYEPIYYFPHARARAHIRETIRTTSSYRLVMTLAAGYQWRYLFYIFAGKN